MTSTPAASSVAASVRSLPPARRRRQQLERAAIHEAGHAVIGVVLGLRVERVSIEPAGMSGGHVLARSWNHQPSAAYALAGYAAEDVLLDVPFVAQLWDVDGGDAGDATTILSDKSGRAITPDDPEFTEAHQRAKAAAQAASRRIRAVAALLLDVRVVEGEETVRRLVKGAGDGLVHADVEGDPREVTNRPSPAAHRVRVGRRDQNYDVNSLTAHPRASSACRRAGATRSR